ncbi:MAG: hypothetical protein FWD34_01685 [Oscillospiraceae bacterium]|nr:hypothetical protein [Oscillospiraceae bacterium]
MSKSNKKKKKKIKDNVKIKETPKIVAFLGYALPVVLIIAFLVGGFLLFIYMDNAKYEPNERYLFIEELVKEKTLIGLNYDECKEIVLMGGYVNKEGEWLYPAGSKIHPESEGFITYELCVYNENGVATRAIIREMGVWD